MRRSIVAAILLAFALAFAVVYDARPQVEDSRPDRDVEEGRLVRLTRSYDTEKNPAWSHLGDTIAFQCFNDGEPISRSQATNRTISSSKPFTYPGNICIMNADGPD